MCLGLFPNSQSFVVKFRRFLIKSRSFGSFPRGFPDKSSLLIARSLGTKTPSLWGSSVTCRKAPGPLVNGNAQPAQPMHSHDVVLYDYWEHHRKTIGKLQEIGVFSWDCMGFTLWKFNIAIEHGHRKFVSFLSKNGDFP